MRLKRSWRQPPPETDAAADGLPPEAVLQIEAVVRRDFAERVDVLDPEHRPLELAALVGLERLGFLGALLCEVASRVSWARSTRGLRDKRKRDGQDRRPTRHRP